MRSGLKAMYIYNAKIMPMDSAVIPSGYVEVKGGRISQVSAGAPPRISDSDIDAAGRILMPGLIDILGRQSRKPDEIIVIDSESEDATVRMAEQAGFRTLKVKRSEFDHGGTRNYAVAMSNGDIVMFLSQDALPSDENYVENIY